jgi:hypothetical protein
MKRKFLVLMLSLGVVGSAHAQFGALLGGAKGGGGGGDVSALVDEFNRDSVLIREAVTYSLIQIVAALGDKQQIAEVRAKNDSLSKTTDPKEAGSLQGQAVTQLSVVVQQLLDSADAKQKMEKLSPEMQKKVGQSILAVGIAGLRIPGMLDKGQRAIEGVGANPMMVTKIVPVKDGVAIFAETLPKLTKIASTGLALMRDVKMEAGTPTADAKLVVDKNVSIPE